jgi:hypothetical protein
LSQKDKLLLFNWDFSTFRNYGPHPVPKFFVFMRQYRIDVSTSIFVRRG